MGTSKVVWAVILSLLSCAPVAEYPKTELIKKASQRWYDATCRVPRYVAIAFVKDPAGAPDEFWGYYDINSGVIEIAHRVPPDKLLQVLTHEMGHSLAPKAGHVLDGTGVMGATVRAALPLITAVDHDLVCKDYDCPCKNPENP